MHDAPDPRGATGGMPLVAVAASAGGIPALGALLAALPRDFPAPVLVLLHIEATRPSHLAEVLGRLSALPVAPAAEGDAPLAGRVYVAPPDRHLVVRADGRLGLTDTPREHHVRPSADPLFASAARAAGTRAVAVVLSGMGTDGNDGVREVCARGGTVVAQDAATAAHFAMPAAAIATGCVDHVLPLGEIAPFLVNLLTPAD